MTTTPEPAFSVNVDVTNPGQFFACCGLLELAHRLWPGAEAWFELPSSRFVIRVGSKAASLQTLFYDLRKCRLSGLSEKESKERKALEKELTNLKKQGRALPSEKEVRRQELGTQARKGAIRIGPPFDLLLNWWQVNDDDTDTPKTWAGRQEILRVARAAQDALSGINEPEIMFNHSCVLRNPSEYCRNERERRKKIEPFYFDARRFVHALDTGFSLDALGAETIAHPAVELLCLIGLQRFRPTAPERWHFEYWPWSQPLCAPVAAAVASGLVPTPARRGYRFRFCFRDDQKRYKAFDFATPV